jgi:phosphoglycolate phosphatase
VSASRKWIEADAYVFDIDGTLLHAYGGAHYNSFHFVLEKHFGLTCKIDGVPLHGNTDTGILRAVLAREGVAAEQFDLKREAVFTEMCDEVEKNRDQVRSELCPGITQLLAELKRRGKLLGLATGNLERIGWIKVESAGVRDYFTFGAFSDGHENRTEIFRDAMDRARKQIGSSASVCFVGDTVHDVTAAKALNAPVIAVATGIFTVEQLTDLRPDVCVRSCEDLLAHIPNATA